jgi:hypothetical protein
MCCTLDPLIHVSSAYCLVDFCGDRVNCSITIAEEAGLVVKQGLPVFACAHHALYHRPQIYHECMQLLIMLEAPLQIHTATAFVRGAIREVTSVYFRLLM